MFFAIHLTKVRPHQGSSGATESLTRDRRAPQVKNAPGEHAGKTQYIKGMPAELGGHNVYEGQLAMLRAWLCNPHFCPTEVPALRALQSA